MGPGGSTDPATQPVRGVARESWGRALTLTLGYQWKKEKGKGWCISGREKNNTERPPDSEHLWGTQ